jgi:hypothetical protein
MMATPGVGVIGSLVIGLALVGVLGPVPLGLALAFVVGMRAGEPPVG